MVTYSVILRVTPMTQNVRAYSNMYWFCGLFSQIKTMFVDRHSLRHYPDDDVLLKAYLQGLQIWLTKLCQKK